MESNWIFFLVHFYQDSSVIERKSEAQAVTVATKGL
jgi:hypothetical protein